jgi:hypothetical protein
MVHLSPRVPPPMRIAPPVIGGLGFIEITSNEGFLVWDVCAKRGTTANTDAAIINTVFTRFFIE